MMRTWIDVSSSCFIELWVKLLIHKLWASFSWRRLEAVSNNWSEQLRCLEFQWVVLQCCTVGGLSQICVQIYKVGFSTLPCRLFALNHQLKNFTLNHDPFGKCYLAWINLIEFEENYRIFSTDPRMPVTCFGLNLPSLELHSNNNIDLPRLDWSLANGLCTIFAQCNASHYPTAFMSFWFYFRLEQPAHIPDHINGPQSHLQLHIACMYLNRNYSSSLFPAKVKIKGANWNNIRC